jgi:DNA-binding response OmpR family regulator
VKKILIVEDDPNVAASLNIRFQTSGYTTLLASDAVQATRLARESPPDLAVLDISIPAGNGITLAEKLKKTLETKDIPIVFITASKDPQLAKKIANLNVAGFFEKPYDFDELLAVVRYSVGDSAGSHSKSTEFLQKQSAWPKTRTERILIVEDDESIAMALALRLKAAGYETMLAFDAVLGLTTAVRTPPDLVLLDISMPAGNGLSLAQKIKTLLPEPPPVIFLTAGKQPSLRQKAMELGAAGFFEKPYEAEELLAAIEQGLEANRPHLQLNHE